MEGYLKFRYLIALAGGIALGLAASAASAATKSFEFTSSENGGLIANFSLDVVGGQAIGGTGTISAPSYLSGFETLSLVTLSTPGVHDLGGGNLSYRFGGGTDLIGDTAVPIDGGGPVFFVNTPGNPALDVGFNVWSNGGTSYTGFLAGNDGIYASFNGGLASVSPVPLPAAMPLFGAVLAGLGGFGWLRNRKKTA